jgi:phosphoglycerol transferase
MLYAKRSRYFSGYFQSCGRWVVTLLPYCLLLGVLLLWAHQVSLYRYVTADFGPDYFSSHYIPPTSVQVREENPKNLILIYVESLESSYSDKTLFGTDMLTSLNHLGGVSFTHYQQAPGTSWTIAAIVATQCGVPLKTFTIFGGNTPGNVLNSFLPNAKCLGDILSEHGFHNVFMGGATEKFASKGKFLRSHHYDEVYGKEDWIRQGINQEETRNWSWGLSDANLFAAAKRKLRELKDSKTRFNLTLLTLDTHHPAGRLSEHCAALGYSTFGGIVQCTAEEVADFVRFIQDNGYLADTNVMILGDHLVMQNPLADKIFSLPERYIFNEFISNKPPRKNREDILHFDLLPTILEFVGFDVVGGRMGLGYSAFNEPKQIPPDGRLAEMKESLLNRSQAYMELWGISQK